MKVGIKLLPNYDKEWDLPVYEHIGDAGMDVKAAISGPKVLQVGCRLLIPTGITVDIPLGYEIQVRPRSGLAYKKGITILNTPGTIDHKYRKEIGIILANFNFEPAKMNENNFTINPGDRIAQIVLKKVEEIEWVLLDRLEDTGRGGFGSTGV